MHIKSMFEKQIDRDIKGVMAEIILIHHSVCSLLRRSQSL